MTTKKRMEGVDLIATEEVPLRIAGLRELLIAEQGSAEQGSAEQGSDPSPQPSLEGRRLASTLPGADTGR